MEEAERGAQHLAAQLKEAQEATARASEREAKSAASVAAEAAQVKRLAAERDALQRRVSRFQAAGRTETAAGQSALEEQVEFYKKLVKCPLACNRDKSVVTKCGHSFCRECIDHRLNLRNRKCPTCSVVIDCTPAHVPPAAPGHAPPASKPRRRPRAARRPTCSSPSRRAAPRSAIRSGPDAAVAHFLSPLRRGRRGTRARGGGDDGTPRLMKAQNPSTVERKTLVRLCPASTVGMLSNSLYCEARVLTPPGMAQGSSRPAGRVLTFAWSEAPQSMLLAVALDNATVILLNEHAEPYYEGAVLSTKSRVANARCLCWSPAASGSLMLAIGWEDGSVMVWADGPNANDRVAREDTDQHATHPVTFVLWSPDASRLISGDGRAVGAAPVPHSPSPSARSPPPAPGRR